MLQLPCVVVQAEQKRTDECAFSVFVPTEAGDDAIAVSLMLDLEHDSLIGLIRGGFAFGNDTVEAGAFEAFEPSLRGYAVMRGWRDVQWWSGFSEQRFQCGAAFTERSFAKILVAAAKQIEKDDGRGRLFCEQLDARCGGVDAKLESIEVEAVFASDDDFAIEHALLRQLLFDDFEEFWKVAVERLGIAALKHDLVAVAKDDDAEAIPLRFEDPVVAFWKRLDALGEHGEDGRLWAVAHGENRTYVMQGTSCRFAGGCGGGRALKNESADFRKVSFPNYPACVPISACFEGFALKMSPAAFNRFVLAVAGIGGLLYGIDVGIFDAASLYLDKTVNLSVSQMSIIAAAVFGGSMVSSLVGGFLADWFGRKKMMIASGAMFVLSIVLIVFSQNFVNLLTGRLLQGISGGVIAVVVPLYLAESLSADTRGKGSAIFQFMLTFGIVMAALVGLYYTRNTEAAIAAAGQSKDAIRAAQDHAWRGMFLAIIYPGILFFFGTLFLVETPRWLFRRGKSEQALASLRKFSSEEEAQMQIREMSETTGSKSDVAIKAQGSLLKRKYVYPFVLACVVLACNQATGINSILTYLALILKQAGMSVQHATQGDLAVKVLNCLMTVVAVALIDRKGRKFLLTIGTAGIILALSATAFIFHHFESQRVDVSQQVTAGVQDNKTHLPLAQLAGGDSHAVALTVLYSYGAGDHVASVSSNDTNPVLELAPVADKSGKTEAGPLTIRKASIAPLPSSQASTAILIALAFFIASFAVGPGVVVWLALSELMPTRIRSAGMGIALLLNQGVSTLIAGVFLPMVSNHGYFAVFAFWAACTVIYFITAAFFLPETKGKTLEEIEASF